jgi:DNA transformation protein
LKTDDGTRPHFAEAGGRPFIYDGKGKPITMSYWTPPEEAMDSAEAMRPWARLALEAALRAAKAKPPKQPKKPR